MHMVCTENGYVWCMENASRMCIDINWKVALLVFTYSVLFGVCVTCVFLRYFKK